MEIRRDTLRQIIADSGRPVGIKELLRLGGYHPGQQTELKRELREMLRTGTLEREGKRFKLPITVRKPREERIGAEGVRTFRRGAEGFEGKRGGAPGGYAARRGAAPGSDEAARGAARGGFDGQRRADRQRGGGEGEDRSRPSGKGEVVVGILHVHRDGFGFVHPSSGEGENLYLPAYEARRALDGDKVRVLVTQRGARSESRLLEVLSRRREQMVGTYVVRGREAYVVPHDKALQGTVIVPPTQMARDGDVVKVRLGVGTGLVDAAEGGLFGEVAGTLGKPGDPSVEVLSIAYGQGFSDEFPPEVMDEADAIALEVSEEEARGEGRRDLRKLRLITIDGEDARDFDDAVVAEIRPDGGFRLVVAIADVSQYVREGTALNVEALRRATSVYLPDRVLPMLPERLSNGICSLKPDVDRLCMVADMQLSPAGQLESSELYPAVMRSHARCTYNEVQDVLEGKDVPHRNAFRDDFQRLSSLARVLRRMREDRGAIDFDLPEFKVVLDESGQPVRMDKRERLDSHRLVEECMLAANEAVARWFIERGLPSVYRFHAEPDAEKLAAFALLAGAHGFFLPGDEPTSKQLNALVKQVAGHPEQRALNQLLLRSMMQAVYSSENVGHYGLGAEHYLHFTSPIRRYPDLLVHRLLKAHWAEPRRARSDGVLETETQRLEEMAVQSSQRERAAMSVEREVVSFYATLLMKDRVGEEFDATVAGVTDFGFFVELDEVHVEGLVKVERAGIGGKLDTALHQLVWPNGQRIRVGEKLRVRCVGVSTERRQIDFDLVRSVDFAGGPVDVDLEAAPGARRFVPRAGGPPQRYGGDRGAPRAGGKPGPRHAEDRGGPGKAGKRYGAPGEARGGRAFGGPGEARGGKQYGGPGEARGGKQYGGPGEARGGKQYGGPGEARGGKQYGGPGEARGGRAYGGPGEARGGRPFGPGEARTGKRFDQLRGTGLQQEELGGTRFEELRGGAKPGSFGEERKPMQRHGRGPGASPDDSVLRGHEPERLHTERRDRKGPPQGRGKVRGVREAAELSLEERKARARALRPPPPPPVDELAFEPTVRSERAWEQRTNSPEEGVPSLNTSIVDSAPVVLDRIRQLAAQTKGAAASGRKTAIAGGGKRAGPSRHKPEKVAGASKKATGRNGAAGARKGAPKGAKSAAGARKSAGGKSAGGKSAGGARNKAAGTAAKKGSPSKKPSGGARAEKRPKKPSR